MEGEGEEIKGSKNQMNRDELTFEGKQRSNYRGKSQSMYGDGCFSESRQEQRAGRFPESTITALKQADP